MSNLVPFSETIDDTTHGLLEPPSVAYSNVTVRRAFIVWMYCGQRNSFKDVCNYFHHLEALEEKLSAEDRASSRHHEFNLFTNQPPKSAYLTRNFPNLYTEAQQQIITKEESYRQNSKVVTLQELDTSVQGSGTSKTEIIEASRMIRDYCRANTKTLEKFLKEFKEHTEKCGLINTVGNVAFYIKRKMIQAEIQLEANYAMTLALLTNNEANGDVNVISTSLKVKCNINKGKSVALKKCNSLHCVSTDILPSNKKSKKTKQKIANVPNNNAGKDFLNKFNNIDKNKFESKENIPKRINNQFF